MTSSSDKLDDELDTLQLFVQARARKFGIGFFRIEFMMTIQKSKRLTLDYEKYASRLFSRIDPKLEFVEIVAVWDADEYFRMDNERLEKYGKSD